MFVYIEGCESVIFIRSQLERTHSTRWLLIYPITCTVNTQTVRFLCGLLNTSEHPKCFAKERLHPIFYIPYPACTVVVLLYYSHVHCVQYEHYASLEYRSIHGLGNSKHIMRAVWLNDGCLERSINIMCTERWAMQYDPALHAELIDPNIIMSTLILHEHTLYLYYASNVHVHSLCTCTCTLLFNKCQSNPRLDTRFQHVHCIRFCPRAV